MQLLSKELRIHWSKTPIPRYIPTEQLEYCLKPRGLWYAVNNSWVKHDASGYYEIAYKVNILSKNILLLSSHEDVIEFIDQYIFLSYINWKKVAQDYDGIEINPYKKFYIPDVPSLLIEASWYYAWDVASGCLWYNNACYLEKLDDSYTA